MTYQDFLNIPIEIIKRDKKYLKHLNKMEIHYKTELTVAHAEDDRFTVDEYSLLLNDTRNSIEHFLNLSNNTNQEPTNENT